MKHTHWRDKQAHYHRSDTTSFASDGTLTVQCRQCEEFKPFYFMFRCFDCGAWLCRDCCWHHFGSNAHVPHPIHLHEYIERIVSLEETNEELLEPLAKGFDQVDAIVDGFSEESSPHNYTLVLNDNLLCLKQWLGDAAIAIAKARGEK